MLLWYKLSMATLRKQKVGQYVYWQIVESNGLMGNPDPWLLLTWALQKKLLYRLTQGPVQKEIHLDPMELYNYYGKQRRSWNFLLCFPLSFPLK